VSSKRAFQQLARAYLDAVEGAVGCRIDAGYTGKTFVLSDLTATLKNFYSEWSPESTGLKSGEIIGLNEHPRGTKHLHSAQSIDVPLRSRCINEPGIYIIMDIQKPDRIRSILMFADVVLFWDPFELAIRDTGWISKDDAELALSYLMPLRPLIAAGLLVPAQVARTRAPGTDGSTRAEFASNLMWQGALGAEEFERRTKHISSEKYQLSVPEGPFAARGLLGHAENKIASLFLPDIVIPLIDYQEFSTYDDFCESIDRGLKSREIEYFRKSLLFDTGFVINSENISNELLLELRERDILFATVRETILKAVEGYEAAVQDGLSASFIEEFNVEIQNAFRSLKEKAIVSNTWKDYVDQSKTLSTNFVAKILTSPLRGKSMIKDSTETLIDTAIGSVANVALASLKTYTRYKNTKVLLDVVGAIRDNHVVTTTIKV
jgi:hypothetical protein